MLEAPCILRDMSRYSQEDSLPSSGGTSLDTDGIPFSSSESASSSTSGIVSYTIQERIVQDAYTAIHDLYQSMTQLRLPTGHLLRSVEEVRTRFPRLTRTQQWDDLRYVLSHARASDAVMIGGTVRHGASDLSVPSQGHQSPARSSEYSRFTDGPRHVHAEYKERQEGAVGVVNTQRQRHRFATGPYTQEQKNWIERRRGEEQARRYEEQRRRLAVMDWRIANGAHDALSARPRLVLEPPVRPRTPSAAGEPPSPTHTDRSGSRTARAPGQQSVRRTRSYSPVLGQEVNDIIDPEL